MSRSPLALGLGGPPPYPPDDYYYFLQHGGGGDVHEDQYEDHFTRGFPNDLQFPAHPLESSLPLSAASAGSALSSQDDPDSSGSDAHLQHHSSQRYRYGYRFDSNNNSNIDSDSEPPSAASPPFPSRAAVLSLSPSLSASASATASPAPGAALVDRDSDSDSPSDPGVVADPGLASASASASASGSGSSPGSSPGPGFDFDSDFDLDSGQDTDLDQDPAGPGSSPSSPNPDPLLDRPRHHLQSNDIGNNTGVYWHPWPPRQSARPARASLTPDIHPNRRQPAPQTHGIHRRHPHHPHHHRHRHQNRPSARPIRHPANPDNRPSPPNLARRHQSHLRSEPQPVSQPHAQSRPRIARPRPDPFHRTSQSQRPLRHGHGHSRQQAALVESQGLQAQHEDHEDHEGVQHHNNGEGEDHFPLREHLRLRRARRAARVAREAGRQPPARGNWGPFTPAGRTAAGATHDSGREDLDHSDSMDHDDELIEVVYSGPVIAPPTPPRRQQRQARPQRQQRHRQHQELMDLDLDLDLGLELELDQHVPVIDLTEEPDSPELQRHRPVNILRHHSHNHNQNHGHNHSHTHIHILNDDDDDEEEDDIALYQLPRNPRRHMSQNGRMPSLNRSDGSILNGNAAAAVIDLTLDSPDESIPAHRRLPPLPAAQQLNQPAHRNHRRLPAPASPAPAAAAAAPPAQRAQYQDFGRHLIGSIRGLIPGILAQAVNNPREADVQFVGVGAAPAAAFPMNPNPLAGNPPEFNYQANGFGGYGGRQPTPKPDFQAPPPSRPGFTRDTRPDGGEAGADEELVVVCPSCDNELKYSPDDEDDSPRPAKKPRGKKSQEEHHFWAVKNCGHVYCKNCYDNRKKHSKGKDSAAAKTGFRFQPSETSKSIKIFCAVDDCESEVSPNAAWVGIFM